MKGITVTYTSEKWEPLKAEKPYSENNSHLLDHEAAVYWCYWCSRSTKPLRLTDMTFLIGDN